MNKIFDFSELLSTPDPYGLLRQYSANGPVQTGKSSIPGYEKAWYFFGFEEARQLLKSDLHEPLHRVESHTSDIQLSEDRALIWKHLAEWPLFQNPPLHADRRALVANTFREAALGKLESHIKATADGLLDKASGSTIEIPQEFSFPLAVTGITAVLGLPPPDVAWFKNLTGKISDVLALGYVPNAYGPGLAALNELISYAEESIAWKQQHLADDLLSQLLRPLGPDAALDHKVIVGLLTQILIAGQETVGDGISNGVNLLATHPDQLKLARENPQLVGNAVQEILRFDCPVQFTSSRTVTGDMQFGDIKIAEGEITIVALGACNRDGRRFNDPDCFDIKRDLSGTEISFGHGIHYCLGAHFARMVMRIAFQTLLQRLPGNWVLESAPVWRRNTVFRGPATLTLSL